MTRRAWLAKVAQAVPPALGRLKPGPPWGAALAGGFPVAAFAGTDAAPGEGGATFRVIASSSLLSVVNENDARAALKSWAETLTQQTGLRVRYDQQVLSEPESIFHAVQTRQTDAVALTLLEYVRVAPYLDPASIVIDQMYANPGEEYQLLAAVTSNSKTVADLRGRSLLAHHNATTCLAPAWLDTLLAAEGLGTPERFFGPVTYAAKATRAVLPVYFGQADCGLVTRREFATMAELNPQLEQKLRVIATSPKLLPVIFAFHKDCPAATRERIRTALLNLHTLAVGRQLLTLFQSRGLAACDPVKMRDSLAMVAAAERIRAQVSRAGKAHR